MEEKKKRRWSSTGFCVKALGKNFRIMTAGGGLFLPHYRIAAEEMLQRTHTHFTFELLFAPQSEITLISEGGIARYENRALIVPPGLKHCSTVAAGDGYNLLVLPQFDVSEYESLSGKEVTALDMTDDLCFYVRQLAREWERDEGTEVAEHLASLILHRVFGQLLGEGKNVKQAHATPASPIGIIEGYVNGNYSRNITLGDLSVLVHLCDKQVARIIKREYGMTLTQLLAQKRVGAAEMLLKNTDMKISEIAQKVSPAAESSFFATFKELTGMSPLQYRKVHQPHGD